MGQEIWVNLDAHAWEGNACQFGRAFLQEIALLVTIMLENEMAGNYVESILLIDYNNLILCFQFLQLKVGVT